jgi:phospholipid/cholesterol/gamma-HCH transport system substrate-binding protein
MSPFRAGLLAIVVLAVLSYAGLTRLSAFSDPYELKAVFANASNLQPRSPVRIAGVEVGKVKKVEALEGGGARVSMQIDDEGLPIHTDARLKIRPRIFLEGNFFVDMEPGSPSAPLQEDGGRPIPMQQTAAPVQFSDVLNTLQSDTRSDIQVLLRELSKGFEGEGARGFNESIRYWESAYRNSALTNQATLGEEPTRDIRRLLRGQQRTFAALVADEDALKGLITSFNRTAGAFAREDAALEASVPALRDTLRAAQPALASLNSSLPSLRRFARDALPGVRSSGPALKASLPFITQLRRLVRRSELRGTAAELRRQVPNLVRLNQRSVPLFEQGRALSACQNRVLLPFAKAPIPDPDFPAASGQPWYKEAQRAFVGLAGEGRLHDANTPFYHVLLSAGPATTVSTGDDGTKLVGTSLFPVLGVRPYRSPRPRFRPDLPCETQEPPNLSAPSGQPDQRVTAKAASTPRTRARKARSMRELRRVQEHIEREKKGLPTIDPLRFSAVGERLQARKLGLVRDREGTWVTRAERRREEGR